MNKWPNGQLPNLPFQLYWLPYFRMPWGSYCALPINQHLVQCASAHWDFANWWRVIANIPECRNWNCNKYSSSGPCGPSRICRFLFHRFPVRHTWLVLCFSLYKMTNWTVCLFIKCSRREGKGWGVAECKRAFDGSKKYAELNMMGNCNGDFN